MPLRQDELDPRVDESDERPTQGSQAGATVQLGNDYFTYARERFGAAKFKEALVRRLLPTVPMRGRPHAIRPGESFGKFKILDRLGKGGMAEVYQALDPERTQTEEGHGSLEARQSVALKVMKPEIALNPEFVGRFLREAANTALIDHPNVVQVLEVGSVAGRLYFTMELIEGMTLKDHLREHDLTEVEGVQILCQLVDGLVAAHECGISHRDLKPANLMVVTSQERYGFGLKDEFDVLVKITDFGLAHQIDLDKSDLMRGGRFLGTAKYVAPEVVMGGKSTLKSDVFSLGIMAFTMFAGRSPFKARNKTEYIAANIQLKAPMLDTMSNVSHDLAVLVNATLRKDPKHRPEARSLRRDLARLAARTDENQRVRVSGDPASVFNVDAGQRRDAAQVPIPAVVGGVVVVVTILAAILMFGGDRGGDANPVDPPEVVTPKDPPVRPKDPPVRPKDPPVRPTDPPAYSGDPLLAPISVEPSAFIDRLAKTEFVKLVESGDTAWRAGDKETALDRWTEASDRLKRRPKLLRVRVKTALKEVALEKGAAAEKAGELPRALAHYDRALQLGVIDDELSERAERLRTRVAQEREFKRRLRRARVLGRSATTRDQAVTELRELFKLAGVLGLANEVEAELSVLGVTPKAPGSGTDAPEKTLSSDDERMLGKASDLIGQQSYDAAELAVQRVRGRTGATKRLRVLEERIARGRRTPSHMIYVEGKSEPAVLPHGFYVSKAPVTNARFYAWFKEASRNTLLVPPSSWKGRSAPPAGVERDPVRGVREAVAAEFAKASSARVPTAKDAERLAGVLAIELPERDSYSNGFRLILDVK